MQKNKRKKLTRYRGSHTHGGGSKKKRRGAGNRGGRGNAGSGKRADVKKPSNWKRLKYFGRHGFTTRYAKMISINVVDLEVMAPKWVEQNKAKLSNGVITVDLTSMGVDKLIGSGKIRGKYSVKVALASPKAKEKIAALGGEVTETARFEASTEAKEEAAEA